MGVGIISSLSRSFAISGESKQGNIFNDDDFLSMTIPLIIKITIISNKFLNKNSSKIF